jgi:pimeloyl-ACP methyl ester carboxylesterase
LRALVTVDIAPEISEEGRKMIGGFVRSNQEFDDLDHFIRNVRKYDPYRSREHIERTVKYNMLQRADGKFVSKCDATPRRLGLVRGGDADHVTLDDIRRFPMPTLVVRGSNSNVVTPEAAEHFRDALPRGQLAVVPDCGHNVHGQNTLGFLSALNGFVEGLE